MTRANSMREIDSQHRGFSQRVIPPASAGGFLRMVAFTLLLAATAHAADLPDAWQAAAAWRAGADVSPLLAIEQEQIASMATPDARAAHAARLAAVVSAESSSLDARQWACLQLRFAGTAAEEIGRAHV